MVLAFSLMDIITVPFGYIMEWLYRLIKEPRRLGRMMRLPKFVFAALKKRMKG